MYAFNRCNTKGQLGLTDSQLPHEPASVHTAEETSWTPGSCWPEWFEKTVADDANDKSVAVTFDRSTRIFGLQFK